MGFPRMIHDMPEDDWVMHTASERCVCGPQRMPMPVKDDERHLPRTFLVVHPRLDGKTVDGHVD